MVRSDNRCLPKWNGNQPVCKRSGYTRNRGGVRKSHRERPVDAYSDPLLCNCPKWRIQRQTGVDQFTRGEQDGIPARSGRNTLTFTAMPRFPHASQGRTRKLESTPQKSALQLPDPGANQDRRSRRSVTLQKRKGSGVKRHRV